MFKKKELEKEYVIPIFVPHLGCPQACTFCNQVRISGQETTVTAKLDWASPPMLGVSLDEILSAISSL